MMTAERLAEIEAADKARAQGKWEESIVILPNGDVVTGVTCDGDEVCNMGQTLLSESVNAHFIATAANVIPDLLAAYKEKCAEVERLEVWGYEQEAHISALKEGIEALTFPNSVTPVQLQAVSDRIRSSKEGVIHARAARWKGTAS